MSATCILCARSALATDAERATRVCAECAQTTGVVPLPPSRRPPLPCMRCQQPILVRVVPRELTAGGGDYVRQLAAPMMLTYAVQSQKRAIFAGNEVDSPAVGAGYGVLEAFVCCACGFVEWYCQAPESLPVGPAFNSELVDVSKC